MPTLCGLRRRGYTPRSIRNFSERNGVAKAASNTVEFGFLEHCLREDLNATAQRTMAVLHPVAHRHQLPRGPERDRLGRKQPQRSRVPMRSPSAATCGSRRRIFWRCLFPSISACTPDGPECRLKGAYLIRCTGCVKDENGHVTEVLCEYDPNSRGGDPADGRKVKGRYSPLGGCRQLSGCRGAAVRQPVLRSPSPTARTRISWTA